MKIKRIAVAAFLAILLLFLINFSIYIWSTQKRNASFESLRATIARLELEASIRQQLGDLQKQVELTSQISMDSTSAGLGAAEIEKFEKQLASIEESVRMLEDLSGPDLLPAVKLFASTVNELSGSWIIVYQNFGVQQARAVTELVTRSEPLAALTFERLGQLLVDENRRVDASTANFRNVASLTTRVTVLIFSVTILLALAEAWVVTRAVTRLFREEEQLLAVTAALSSELNLVPLLVKIMDTTTALLDAERSTLFLHDAASGELWSQVAQGVQLREIRFPATMGIAGTVFKTGETINIPNAYKDQRFNPAVDKATGFRTRSILCMPVINKRGECIGVSQVLNKRGGSFTRTDESRLAAFSAQASIALENAKLFDDVLNMKNYNESILLSLSDGVVTLDTRERIIKCNDASLRILQVERESIEGVSAQEFFAGENSWLLDTIRAVRVPARPAYSPDAEIAIPSNGRVTVNLTAVPLVSVKQEPLGSMLVLEDITREKRLRGTMARYLTKEVADRLMEAGEGVLGGQRQMATVMFSDIRNFTTLAEQFGSPETVVSFLNEYFTLMIDVIFHYSGVLDKYIGDAIMAVFGVPFASPRDADNAVAAAVKMMSTLREFNERRRMAGSDAIRIGIGINTSEVVSGNIGSLKRMDYTVIGDGVNLASRLEGINKYYGTQILISEYTRSELSGTHLFREAGLIRVKGKEHPVTVYEVLDYHDQNSFPHLDEALTVHAKAMSLYRNREFDSARNLFAHGLRLNPRDGLSHIYRDRCDHLLRNPPGQSWDGTWVMQNK